MLKPAKPKSSVECRKTRTVTGKKNKKSLHLVSRSHFLMEGKHEGIVYLIVVPNISPSARIEFFPEFH